MHDFTLGLGPADAISRHASSRPLFRWAGLTALLVAEVLALSLLFTTLPFADDHRWWVRLLSWSPMMAKLAAAFGVAMLAFGGRSLVSELGRLSNVSGRADRGALFLAGHLGSFAAFAAMSAWLSDRVAGPSPVAGGLVLGCGLLGLTTIVLWGAAALPAALWVALIRRFSGVVAVGTLVGGGAVLMGQWTQSLWNPLSRSTFWAVTHLLRLAFRDVVHDPERMAVGTSTFAVSIAPSCSGYEGIGLVWALLLGSLWLFRRQFRFPRAFLLLPIGAALMWAANSLRIAGLVGVGTLFSPSIAAGGFHSQTGWISFSLIGLGLVAGAQRCRYFLADVPRPMASTHSNPTASYLMPLLTLVASAMITGAFTAGFDWAYSFRMIAVLAVFAWYRRCYADSLRPGWSWAAFGIGAAVFALWMALEPGPVGTPTGFDPRERLSTAWAFAWIVARVAGSVLIVPLAEELAFRGYLARRLVASDFRGVDPGRLMWASMAVSSIAFGTLHGRWLAGTLAGVCYALAYRRRGRLGDAVLAHATTNALIAAYVLATGTWSLWS